MKKIDELPDEVVLCVTIGTIQVPPLPVKVLRDQRSPELRAARAKALGLVGKEFDATVKKARAELREMEKTR